MKVTYKHSEYFIRFHHDQPEQTPRRTYCHIEVKSDDDIDDDYSEGVATCGKSDQFVKETGRKIALRRALRSFNRDLRTIVWRAYMERKQTNEVSVHG